MNNPCFDKAFMRDERIGAFLFFRNGVIDMEKTNVKNHKTTMMQMITAVWPKVWDVMRKMAAQIGRMSFWGMAFLCFVFRLFMVYPLGACAAIATSCIWLYWNLSAFKTGVLKGLWIVLGALGGRQQQSIWFEHEGREKIKDVINRLSAQGINYCNLVEQVEDLPPENQWYAICNGLKAMGLVAQTARRALYITWRLPEAAAE